MLHCMKQNIRVYLIRRVREENEEETNRNGSCVKKNHKILKIGILLLILDEQL